MPKCAVMSNLVQPHGGGEVEGTFVVWLQLMVQNEKLRYQVEHLKRAIREGDEKLARVTSTDQGGRL